MSILTQRKNVLNSIYNGNDVYIFKLITMNRKNLILLIGILFQLIFIGCKKCDKNVLEHINIYDWNRQTLKFMEAVGYSNVIFNKNNKPIFNTNPFHFLNIKEDALHYFSFRIIALEKLKNSYKVKSCKLDIQERYISKNYARYIIRDDEGFVYQMYIDCNKRSVREPYYMLEGTEKVDYSDWFVEVQNIENKYYSSVQFGLDNLVIYSRIYFKNDSLVIDYPFLEMRD